MKQFLLCVLLFLSAVAFAAKPGTHRLYIRTNQELQQVKVPKGLAGGVIKADGSYAGLRYYFNVTKPEGEEYSISFTPGADGEIILSLSAMRGLRSRFQSLNVNGKELLETPLAVAYGRNEDFPVPAVKGQEMTVKIVMTPAVPLKK